MSLSKIHNSHIEYWFCCCCCGAHRHRCQCRVSTPRPHIPIPRCTAFVLSSVENVLVRYVIVIGNYAVMPRRRYMTNNKWFVGHVHRRVVTTLFTSLAVVFVCFFQSFWLNDGNGFSHATKRQHNRCTRAYGSVWSMSNMPAIFCFLEFSLQSGWVKMDEQNLQPDLPGVSDELELPFRSIVIGWGFYM